MSTISNNSNGMSFNSSNSTQSNSVEDYGTLHLGRYEFLHTQPALAIPAVIILCIASFVGTFGNILTLAVITAKRNMKNVESIFMINLVISDFYIIFIANPMSIVAKIEGEYFFEQIPGLCQTVASLCTVSCVASLMTIGLLSINRFVYICAHDKYGRIFTKCNCICMCISVYFVGCLLVLLNVAGIGDHGFDQKTMECIWDRMATYPYTVVFSVTLVWTPAVVIGACYLKIYFFVRAHGKRMREVNSSAKCKSFQLAKTFFMIYVVFITCWAPYAILIVVDSDNSFARAIHVSIALFAHLHPSMNWLIYYLTNKKFAAGFNQLLSGCKPCRSCDFARQDVDMANQSEVSNQTETSQGYGTASNTQIDMIVSPDNVQIKT